MILGVEWDDDIDSVCETEMENDRGERNIRSARNAQSHSDQLNNLIELNSDAQDPEGTDPFRLRHPFHLSFSPGRPILFHPH